MPGIRDRVRSPAALALLLVALLHPAGPAQAADCPDASDTPRPAWASVSWLAGEDRYAAAGSAARGDRALTEAVAEARLQGLRQIAQRLETRVTTDLQLTEQAAELDGEFSSSADFTAVTRESSEVLLSGARTAGVWIDGRTCTAWVLVEVPADEVETWRHARIDRFRLDAARRLQAEAERGDRAATARARAAQQALALVADIDPANLPGEAAALPALTLALQELAARLGTQAGQDEQLQAGLARARELRAQAVEADPATARRHLDAARVELEKIVAGTRLDADDPDHVGHQAAFELAALLADTGDPCAARSLLRRVQDQAGTAAVSERAGRERAALRCDPAMASQAAWRRLVQGRTVAVHSLCRLGDNAPETWTRGANELGNWLRQLGAEARIGSLEAAVSADRQARRCSDRCPGLAAGADLAVLLNCDGEVTRRDNPQNPLGTDHQFKGRVMALVADGPQVQLRDEYSGVGGWNPLSADAALEVVALQALKRLQRKPPGVEP